MIKVSDEQASVSKQRCRSRVFVRHFGGDVVLVLWERKGPPTLWSGKGAGHPHYGTASCQIAPGALGRSADRQAFAGPFYPSDQQVRKRHSVGSWHGVRLG
jgi:hypothetical protein